MAPREGGGVVCLGPLSKARPVPGLERGPTHTRFLTSEVKLDMLHLCYIQATHPFGCFM